MSSSKIIQFEEAPKFFAGLREQGKKIAHSHGIFDLLLPGHVVHLEEAKNMGDVLVVSMPADRHVNKGPGRPFFNEQLRAKTIAAVACVDYVVIVPFPGVINAINAIRPNVFCKGHDSKKDKYVSNARLKEESDAVTAAGGKVAYAGSLSFSTSRILNQNFDHLPNPVKDFCLSLSADVSGADLREMIEAFKDLKVLVIGDTIFDRYSFLQVQGLTSKNRIISGRFLKEETQCGGALAVFRHIKQFTQKVKFLSIVGTDSWVQEILRDIVAPEQDLVLRESEFTTIVKQRFVEPVAEGKEVSKLFAVNYIDRGAPPKAVEKKIEEKLRTEISKADVVVLADFGHGMMQEHIRKIIQETSPFLALNCQTNSNNHGYNIISRQYTRADAFTLDQQELMLSTGRRDLDFAAELKSLQTRLGSRYAWLTRGGVETIGLLESNPPCLCPPLEYEVVDTLGAGDAFFSVAALAAAKKFPITVATFIGQLAGAQAVRIVGNERPISCEHLLTTGMSLLNF
jgi:cytidyltransferase-like protein